MMAVTILALLLLNIVFSLYGYINFMVRGYAFSFLWLGILMYFAIGLADLPNARLIFADDTLVKALMFSFFSLLVLFFVFHFSCSTFAWVVGVEPGIARGGVSIPKIEYASVYLKWLAVLLLLAVPILMVLVFGPGTFQETWTERRLAQSKFAILPTLFAQVLALFPGLFWLARDRIWALGFFVSVIVLSAIVGARLTAVIAFSSMFAALQFRYGSERWVSLLPLLAFPAALGLHVCLRMMRGIDAQDLVTALFDGSIGNLLSGVAGHGVDIFGGERTPLRGFYYVVENEVWHMFTDTLQTIQRILFVWLPHEIFNKPPDVVDLLWSASLHDGYMTYLVSSDAGSDAEKYEMLMRLIVQGSLHCTLWGEALANGGYLAAVAVLIFLAVLFAAQEIILAAAPPLIRFGLTALVISQFFYVARGNTVIGFTHLLFVGVLWCTLIIGVRYLLLRRIIAP